MKLMMTAAFNLTGGDEVSVPLYGFTTGSCDNTRGESIREVFDEINSVLLLVRALRDSPAAPDFVF
jgi:hypothetical protein